uniref:Uncharacterized protein n=1 Tax=Rhizophora mucronata TaxID=61149 RepID=A0A2P2IV72_RHIMU
MFTFPVKSMTSFYLLWKMSMNSCVIRITCTVMLKWPIANKQKTNCQHLLRSTPTNKGS